MCVLCMGHLFVMYVLCMSIILMEEYFWSRSFTKSLNSYKNNKIITELKKEVKNKFIKK